MTKRLLPLLLLLAAASALAQSPKREMRAAWIATVANLDWPHSRGAAPEAQKVDLVATLDRLKSAGCNAVFFQMRTECDALYVSSYEPWSYWLSGQQGQAPSPLYDPLQFAVDEAHKRGMELHAWFNPYRAKLNGIGNDHTVSSHITQTHPYWIITTSGGYKQLDPGLPPVRDYVTMIVTDVVRRYDIDGVHFDDYFYPYSEYGAYQDDSTFAHYNRGFTNRGDWRRDNVNLLVKMVHDSIQIVKPSVKFGISPGGHYSDTYSSIYCDPKAWLNALTIDYINPQLYWSGDFTSLSQWWEAQRNGRHLYTGHAAYSLTPSVIVSQIASNRATPGIAGSVFFRADFVGGALLDSLRSHYYRRPALIPRMEWKDTLAPNAPRNLWAEQTVSGSIIHWYAPPPASDGDTAIRYAVYRFSPPSSIRDFDDARNLVDLTGTTSTETPTPELPGTYYYAVTALDRNENESAPSTFLSVAPPQAPNLAPSLLAPADADTGVLPSSVTFRWGRIAAAGRYHLQLATSQSFADGVFLDDSIVVDTSRTVGPLPPYQMIYWRVAGKNAGGTGPFSSAWSFQTRMTTPAVPVLAYPATNPINVPTDTVFSWNAALFATSYHIQITKDPAFSTVNVDSSWIADTSCRVRGLEAGRIYSWRVRGRNWLGASGWSTVSRFRTASPSLAEESTSTPDRFSLRGNYPNPFNPATTISFDVPRRSQVTFEVFDILGRKVAELLNSEVPPGRHSVSLDAIGWNSGVYIYRMVTPDGVFVNRMLLVK